MSTSPQFSSEMTVVASRRSEERLPVDVRARYGHSGAPTRALCRVTDITRRGARLAIYCDLPPDTIITLNLPNAGPIRARVMWSKEFEAGCAFDTPLSVAAFGNLVAQFAD
jgi:hypothetical protein